MDHHRPRPVLPGAVAAANPHTTPNMRFDIFETEQRRLVLLQGLLQAVQYRANAPLLSSFCAAVGHAVSADRLERDIAWLAEAGLLTHATVHGVTVATLTQHGLDVAGGAATVAGVARPRP